MSARHLISLVFASAWCCAQVHAQPTEPTPPSAEGEVRTTQLEPQPLPSGAPEPTTEPVPPQPPITSEAAAQPAVPVSSNVAVDDVVAPTSGVGLQMSASELAALGIDAEAPTVDSSLRFSGFADFGFGTLFAPTNSYWRASGALPSHSTFYVGNFNLYIYKQLTETLRTMGEVRFTYLPNGSGAFGFEPKQSTEAFDYTDFGRVTRWGSIIIQRVYVEWTPHPLITIRGGQFLTPYGVWNVDHGTPVIIPVRRPWSIGVGWIPERQTGFEIYGRADLADWSTIGYHLTASNGTGPISEYFDLDENKAVGGRFYWEIRGLGFGWMRFGGSAYYGRDTNALYTATIKADGSFGGRERIFSQYDSLTWAGDFTWDIEGLHVQAELITNQRVYTDKGRATTQTLAGRTLIPSDVYSWGGYALIGYRLPWFGIMPFFMMERVVGELEYLTIKTYSIQGGLNIRPVDVLVLKASFEHVVFQDSSIDPANVLLTQIAWAF